MKYLISLVFYLTLNGCAIHYFDPETNTEHVYGFGHLAMKVQTAGAKRVAIVRGNDYLGLSVGTNEVGGHFGAGWSSRKSIQIIESDTAIELIWPTSDFFNVRIGEPFENIEEINANELQTGGSNE